jgi:hypothetical protein
MFMRFGLCLSALLVVLLLVLVVGRVNAQSSTTITESVSINIDCQAGTVDVSSSEYVFPVNDTTPVHTPSGVNVTSINHSDVNEVTLTFSASNSTLAIRGARINASNARTIGDPVATMMSTGFQTSFTYDYTSIFGQFVYYKAAGKSSLPQFMQSLMSWCFVSDLNGFSPTFVRIAGEPGAYITVDTFFSSNYDWGFSVKCSYETGMSTGSGDHTVDVLNLVGVNSLAPSNYSAYYSDIYLTTVYVSGVDVTIMPSNGGTVTYMSSQPTGLTTVQPPAGVLDARGWHDYYGSGTSPSFRFENDSSPVNQLSYTFSGTVVPEFPSSIVVSLFMVIFTLAAIVAIRRFPRKTKTQN